MKGTILVTGGGGYIGTNLCPKLIKRGYSIVIVDDFVNAKREYIESLQRKFPSYIDIFQFDIRDSVKLDEVFRKYNFCGVIHLAAKKYIGESFSRPQEYMDNNLKSTQTLLECMKNFKVKKLLFASSITVYGDLGDEIAKEDMALSPLSPYAESKMLCERMISDNSSDFVTIICRFSNPCGADEVYNLGDDSKTGNLTLFPYLSKKIKKSEKLMFNGNDHKTKDGTTTRDFIHIFDLTTIVANIFDRAESSMIINVARGEQYSILEVLHAFERAVNKKLDYGFNPKRKNDPAKIAISTQKLQNSFPYVYTKNIEDIAISQMKFIENN